MTTPHAPEGGKEPTRDEVWESLSPEDRAAIERGTKAYYERWAAGRFPPYEEAAADDEGQEILCDFYRDMIGRPIALRREKEIRAAARAEGAAVERQRLAGLTSEQDEDLVRDVADASAEIVHACEWGTTPDRKALETAKFLLLATLSARRVEAMEAAAKVCDDLAFLWHIEARQADVAQYANEFMVKVVALQVAADKIRALIPPAEGPQGVG